MNVVATTLHVANDWLDYVAAFAGAGSLVLAAVAVLVAVRSKRDAQRSADAAEQTAKSAVATTKLTVQMEQRGAEQLQIMRTEHAAFMKEQQRRPEVVPVLEFAGIPNPARPLEVLIRSGATNVGARTAESVLIMTLVPQGVGLRRATHEGRPIGELPLEPQREQQLLRKGMQYPADGLGVRADVTPHVFHTDHFLLTFPEPDIYEIATRCLHMDIANGKNWTVAQINLFAVPPQWTQAQRETG